MKLNYYLNDDIMVRTQGLRRALGRLLGRALEEAPQCRRLTASGRTQWAAAAIAEDGDHVDHVANEVHKQPQEPIMDHVGANTEGFAGGPYDTSVLTSYVDHVATKVWAEEERIELKLASHGRKVEKFGRPVPEIEGIVATTRLSSLITCSLEIGDTCLSLEVWEGITSDDISWGSSIVKHQPERVVQQFGYVQTIPPLHVTPSLSTEEIDDR
ncbi:hypothetical protein GmHk_10G028916 [Glycine max]|nr:hypothetical protein GmHk_10G028916 [Glycine max]